MMKKVRPEKIHEPTDAAVTRTWRLRKKSAAASSGASMPRAAAALMSRKTLMKPPASKTNASSTSLRCQKGRTWQELILNLPTWHRSSRIWSRCKRRGGATCGRASLESDGEAQGRLTSLRNGHASVRGLFVGEGHDYR